jgi:hypothetical protein
VDFPFYPRETALSLYLRYGCNAKLKTLSARLRTELKQMEKGFAIFKRKIKAEVPQEEWKRFGFDNKQ